MSCAVLLYSSALLSQCLIPFRQKLPSRSKRHTPCFFLVWCRVPRAYATPLGLVTRNLKPKRHNMQFSRSRIRFSLLVFAITAVLCPNFLEIWWVQPQRFPWMPFEDVSPIWTFALNSTCCGIKQSSLKHTYIFQCPIQSPLIDQLPPASLGRTIYHG